MKREYKRGYIRNTNFRDGFNLIIKSGDIFDEHKLSSIFKDSTDCIIGYINDNFYFDEIFKCYVGTDTVKVLYIDTLEEFLKLSNNTSLIKDYDIKCPIIVIFDEDMLAFCNISAIDLHKFYKTIKLLDISDNDDYLLYDVKLYSSGNEVSISPTYGIGKPKTIDECFIRHKYVTSLINLIQDPSMGIVNNFKSEEMIFIEAISTQDALYTARLYIREKYPNCMYKSIKDPQRITNEMFISREKILHEKIF